VWHNVTEDFALDYVTISVFCYTWTLIKLDQKYLEISETWCWRKAVKISWTDRVRNAKVLHGVKENREYRIDSKRKGR